MARLFWIRSFCSLLIASTVLQAAAWAGGWTDERTNETFYCRANFPLNDYEGVLRELSQTQADLKRILGIEVGHEPIELYLFKDKRSYQQFLQLRFPQAPDRRALFIKGIGPGQVFVYRSDELPVDLRHESTHALLHANLPMVPLWLDEGLAEYFEVPPAERPYRKQYVSALKSYTLFDKAPRLVTLEAKQEVDEMSAGDYRDAWSWVHFMFHGPSEARQELLAFLNDIRTGTPPGELSERLEERIPNLEQRWVEHFRSLAPPSLATRPRNKSVQ